MNLTGNKINYYSNYFEDKKKDYNKYYNIFTNLIDYISIINILYLDRQLSMPVKSNQRESKLYYYFYIYFFKKKLSLALVLKSTT
jgi:hypothetical protein